MQVIGAQVQDNQLQAVLTETSAGQTRHPAKTFVLATGGILGGGIAVQPPGYAKNTIVETALGLPVHASPDRRNWFQQDFLGAQGHPIFSVGSVVNAHFQPVDDSGTPYFENLFTIGGALDSCDPVRERSLEGIAIVTGYCVGQRIFEQ